MHKLVINGPCQLSGETWVSGAKNSALPILASTILCEPGSVIHRIPHLKDVTSMVSLLSAMGMVFSVDDKLTLTVEKSAIESTTAPSDLVKSMRASILILGPMVSRYGEVVIDLPGGCAIGPRPINFHLNMMEKLGASISFNGDSVHIKADKLVGAEIVFERETVTGTENTLMAAACAEGRTVIKNAAREPEVVDLADFLNKCGAKISGAGTSQIVIDGVEKLSNCEHTVVPDRIEAGTLLIAGAMTQGNVEVLDCNPGHLSSVLKLLTEAGAKLDVKDSSVKVSMSSRPKPVSLSTSVYPGVPTDLQAQFIAMNAIAEGESVVQETIFENRFMHVSELKRMGAKVNIDRDTAYVTGVDGLHASVVKATDLRASAALIMAALCAKGTSVLEDIYHIDRGYANIEEKLSSLGAHIRRHPNYMVL